MNKSKELRLRANAERFSRVERWIVRGIGALVVLLLLSQLALQLPAVRQALTHTDRWEGVRYPEP